MKALLASVAMILGGSAGLAAQMPPPPPMDGPMKMLPLKRTDVPALVAKHFAEVDANHDGGVTEAEIRAFERAKMDARRKMHRDRDFAALDANHDGSVSRQEFDAPPPPPGVADAKGPPPKDGPGSPGGRMGRGGPHGFGPMGGMLPLGGRMFEKADTNKDGKVTLAEAQAFALAMFDKADANHDGVVDRDEVRGMMMAHMRGGMRGHGPHGPGGPDGPGDGGPPLPPPGQ